MRAYWAKGSKHALQPADQPMQLDDGRYCRVVDLENGEIPVRTYGRTPDEVLEKIERTGMHAMTRLTAAPAAQRTPAKVGPPSPATPPARRLTLTADEQMLATTQLSNPAEAPRAIRALFEAATGVDTAQLAARAFQERAAAWEAQHPELKDSFFNKKLITDNARMRVPGGDLSLVTAEVLEQCYQELKAGGYLLTEEDLPANQPPPALPVPPEENPAPRTRQTTSAFATSHRINRNGSPQQLQPWQPKYTREQIQKMPLAQSEKLLRERDKDYLEACDHWWPSRQARA